jgi:hypothetical protein
LAPGKIFKNRYQIQQLIVVGIGEPTADRDGVLRVKDVRGGGIIDDDRFFQISTDLR